jgi:WD40 repeat protein
MVRISPDGRRLAGFVDGKTLRVWNLDRGVLEHEIIVHRVSIQSIAFSADGLQIYAGSRDGDVKVLDATNGRTLTTFSIPKNCFFEIDDARGRLLVSGAKGFAAILDAKTGEMLFSCHTPNTRLAPLWSPDGLAYCVQMGGGAYEVHRIEENKVRD